MTGSWTEDEAVDKPRLRELLAEEEMTTTPHAEHIYGDGPVLTGEERSAFEGHATHSPEVQRDLKRREALRAEELAHLTELRDRVQQGLDKGEIDLVSGTEMLLNISKARMALAEGRYLTGLRLAVEQIEKDKG